MSLYPRQCTACSRTYTHKSSFHNHKANGRCQRWIAKAAKAASETTTIVNNYVQNVQNVQNVENQQNIVININNKEALADVKEIEALLNLDFSTKRLTPDETKAVALFKDVFRDESICNEQQLRQRIQTHQKDFEDTLEYRENFDNYREVAQEIIDSLEVADLPIKDIFRTNVDDDQEEDCMYHEIDMKPRAVLYRLAEVLWKSYFFPPLRSNRHDKKNILNKVIERSVKHSDDDKNACEYRQLRDRKRPTFAAFCQSSECYAALDHDYQDKFDPDHPDEMIRQKYAEAEQMEWEAMVAYRKTIIRDAQWTIEEMDLAICRMSWITIC